MRYRNLLVTLAVLGATLLLAGCPPEPAYPRGAGDELKVSKVVLYQNGIGYFERRGRVDGDVVKLRIRPEQIVAVGNYAIQITWSDGHSTGIYSWQTLRDASGL